MSRYRDSSLECKLYVGDLPRDASEKEVEHAFSYYGPLRSVWVARNPAGFAFVEFEDPRDADDAVRGIDGTMLCGSRVRVEHSTGKVRQKVWNRGGGGGNRFGGGGGRSSVGARGGYNPDDRCYECGGRGHYAYDCRQRRDRDKDSTRRRRSRSNSRSRSNDNRRDPRKRSYSRSRSKDRSRSKSPVRNKSKSRSPVGADKRSRRD